MGSDAVGVFLASLTHSSSLLSTLIFSQTLIITHKYINRKTYLNIKINKHIKCEEDQNQSSSLQKNGTSLFSRLPFSHLFHFSSPYLCQRRSTTTLFSLFRSLSLSLSNLLFGCWETVGKEMECRLRISDSSLILTFQKLRISTCFP